MKTPLSGPRKRLLARALQYLVETPRAQRNRPVVQDLNERFGLSAAEAGAVAHENHLRLARAT